MGKNELPKCCCISHEFSKAAAVNPNKIAVIHACGGAKIIREFRATTTTDAAVTDYDRFYCSIAPSSHPPVYNGDSCFTFSQILTAVDSLSTRLRYVLDGGDDPLLVRPTSTSTTTGSLRSGMPSCAAGLALESYPKIIGIYIAPSVEYIVAVLSVLRCGEAFMPINPMWPKERILSILSLSNAGLLIRCQCYFDGSLSYEPYTLLEHDDGSRYPELFISIKEIIQHGNGSLSLPWPCEIENSRPFCYLMYTSGSTGKPKGVCGTERGLLNRFLWMQESYPPVGEELLFFKTPISFIDHLQEVLGALLTASTLIIPPANEFEENQLFVFDFLQAYSINRLIAIPSLVRVILPALQSPCSTRVQNSLTLMVLSGEIFPLPLWKTLQLFLPKTTILNLYGSTEVSGDCSYFDCKKLPAILDSEALSSVPIGMPISNCDIILVGEDSPDQGEIYVGGFGTATGYYNNLSIESKAFAKFPQGSYGYSVSELESQNYFESGDLAKRLKSGDLIFLGRKDRMVKVNGQRMALEEIESTLRGYHGVVDAIVISRCYEGVTFLEAYIIMRLKVVITKSLKYSIRSWMLGKLPLAMIPNCFFFIKSFPMSSSGKLDYDKFASLTFSMKHEHRESANIQSPEFLEIMKKVFSVSLMVEMVSDDDDFFEMGGNSVSAAHVSHNLGIDMKLLYIFPTPMRLHMALVEKGGTSYIGAKKEKLLLSFDAKAPTNRILTSNRRSSWGLDNKNDCYPTKFQKMDANIFEKNKGSNFGDGYFQKSTSVYAPCSISRCNKVYYAGLHEGNNFCAPILSLHMPRDLRGVLRESWKIHMGSCVDASPLVVLKDQDIFIFIGAHSYRFFCIDAKSGSTCWETKLKGRIECSAAILDNLAQVVVGCYQGNIYFLDFSTGNIFWSFQTGGEVKSQPVVDRSRQLLWCGSYDHFIYGLDYTSHCCAFKIQCGGSIFGAPVIDEIRNALYVASTSGHVTAISVKVSPYSKLWVYDFKAPIFASLSISSPRGTVICCLVDGHVVALNSNGSVFWKAKTGGPIFAGPCLSQALDSQVLICSRDGSICSFELATFGLGSKGGLVLFSTPWHTLDVFGSSYLRLAIVRVDPIWGSTPSRMLPPCGKENGSLVWKYDLRYPITSSAYIDENLQLVSDPYNILNRLVCVCCSNGRIHLLRVPSERKWMAIDGLQELAKVNLHGDIFSSPVMIGGRIFVGCRDDYLHCLTLETSNDLSF